MSKNSRLVGTIWCPYVARPLKVNVNEQQNDLKHLKEQCDIDSEDEV